MSTQEMPALAHQTQRCCSGQGGEGWSGRGCLQTLPVRAGLPLPLMAAQQGTELPAKGSPTQAPSSTYIAVGSAAITAPLLPQGLRREGTG